MKRTLAVGYVVNQIICQLLCCFCLYFTSFSSAMFMLKRLLSRQRANPGVTGAGGTGAAHVRIFQLWLPMFSLACAALLDPGPEKLSVSRNPSFYSDRQHHGGKKKTV